MITLLAIAYTSLIPVQHPVQYKTESVYVANLSANDERDSGSYYQVTTMPQEQPITPLVMPIIEQPINYQDQ